MGKITHYDFRKEVRQQEMKEIQQWLEKTLIEAYKKGVRLTPETYQKVKEYQNRWRELQLEEKEWGGRDRWEEYY